MVNVTGAFVATQQVLRHMGRGGRIIHIGSSMTQYAGFATASAYTLTITVNVVHPGPTDSDMNPADGPIADFVKPGIAVGRYGVGDDIAAAVSYLAGPDASFVTGLEMLVDGGFTA